MAKFISVFFCLEFKANTFFFGYLGPTSSARKYRWILLLNASKFFETLFPTVFLNNKSRQFIINLYTKLTTSFKPIFPYEQSMPTPYRFLI